MLKIAITEESKFDSDYQVLLTSESETVANVLRKKQIDITTKNVFINGKYIKEDAYNKPLKAFNAQATTVFITIKYKTLDKTRRASAK